MIDKSKFADERSPSWVTDAVAAMKDTAETLERLVDSVQRYGAEATILDDGDALLCTAKKLRELIK